MFRNEGGRGNVENKKMLSTHYLTSTTADFEIRLAIVRPSTTKGDPGIRLRI